MQTDIKCKNCGAVWRVEVAEEAELVAVLMECPLCSRKGE